MTVLTVGSLFSGIGGLDLGLERAGMTVRWQSEIDPYASRVLAKHWPNVPNLGDITTIDWSQVEPVDLIAGGYPCQPFSLAGDRRGQDHPSHLWPHFHRAIRHLRPRYALLENVPGHRSLGFGDVLGDLAEIGYDVEWFSLPAAAVGAPHLRWRLFAVATDPDQQQHQGRASALRWTPAADLPPYPDSESQSGIAVDAVPRSGLMVLADTEGERRSPLGSDRAREAGTNHVARHAAQLTGTEPWAVEPDVGRVAHGVPNRVDRLRCLGNAVVPQVAEWIGHQIIKAAT